MGLVFYNLPLVYNRQNGSKLWHWLRTHSNLFSVEISANRTGKDHRNIRFHLLTFRTSVGGTSFGSTPAKSNTPTTSTVRFPAPNKSGFAATSPGGFNCTAPTERDSDVTTILVLFDWVKPIDNICEIPSMVSNTSCQSRIPKINHNVIIVLLISLKFFFFCLVFILPPPAPHSLFVSIGPCCFSHPLTVYICNMRGCHVGAWNAVTISQ